MQYYKLPDTDLFAQLQSSVTLEPVARGRKGGITAELGICSHEEETVVVPLVRSTTAYQLPVQPFPPAIHALRDAIANVVDERRLTFNNAMVEEYTSEYKTMKFHSDQRLDLNDNSWIAIFSCYEQGDSAPPSRILQWKPKSSSRSGDGDTEPHEIVLEHNSVVLFDVARTNREVLHRIVLSKVSAAASAPQTWIGVTLRCSRTFLFFSSFDSGPRLLLTANQLPLQLAATDEEKKQFFQRRKKENEVVEEEEEDEDDRLFTLTISPGDLLLPSCRRHHHHHHHCFPRGGSEEVPSNLPGSN